MMNDLPIRSVFLVIATTLLQLGGNQGLAHETPADPEVRAAIELLGLVEADRPAREQPGWKPLETIVVLETLPDDSNRRMPVAADWLAPVAGGARIVTARNVEEALASAPDADAYLGFCVGELIERAPRLRWIQTYNAGVERCAGLPALAGRPIVLTNMQRVLGPVMAEHGMALLLALSRNLDDYAAAQARREWANDPRHRAPMRRLRGKTLLLVGLGGIGTSVGRLADAFGMRIIAIRASDRPAPSFVSEVGTADRLLDFASRADAVVASVPLTAETTGLFDAKFFASLRRGAYFVNLGRGRSVVQSALIDALKSGQLGGAGLDVTDPEPLPPDDPLWAAPNLLITPHTSPAAEDGGHLRWVVVRENLRRYQSGAPLLSVVDRSLGY